MVISKRNQLGLRVVGDRETTSKVANMIYMYTEHNKERQFNLPEKKADEIYRAISVNFGDVLGDWIVGGKAKYFLITNGVCNPSMKVNVGATFTTRSIKNMQLGRHVYLLGKDKVCFFNVETERINGFYFDESKSYLFYFYYNLMAEEYGTVFGDEDVFMEITRLLVFINLGDIEVVEIEGRKRTGSKKSGDKIVNASDFKVHIVDSSWNKLIVRTDGFAVQGHFRMQPCGPGNKDRKLIWINAFEKNGYVRRPKNIVITE